MATKIVRQSKFRHVFGTATKNENCYCGVNFTTSAYDSNFVTVNPKFLAFPWHTGGGGSVAALPISKVGKIAEVPLFSGHKGPILDLQFAPYNDNLLASASEDATVRIWTVPEDGLKEKTDSASQELKGHKRKIGSLAWHAAASNILATGAWDNKLKIWDVVSGKDVLTSDSHDNVIFSMDWSYNGDRMVTTCKDKKLRVIDPRANKQIAASICHEGTKSSRALWLGKNEKIFSVGGSKTADRQYALWDTKNMDKPVLVQTLDQSSGAMMIFFDGDTNIIYLAGKGDGNIRYFELEGGNVYALDEFKSSKPGQGMGMMPKRGLNINECEVARLYKAAGKDIIPISFTCPRRSTLFQDDIYPPCQSDTAALSGEDWLKGENKDPLTCDLSQGFVPKQAPEEVKFEKKPEEKELTMPELKEKYAEAQNRIAYLETELEKLKKQLAEKQ